MKLVAATLESVIVARPAPSAERPQHICLDKGYDYPQIEELVAQWGYTAHIRGRGEEKQEKAAIPGYRARRWVVERTHSWMNRFRRLLVRGEILRRCGPQNDMMLIWLGTLTLWQLWQARIRYIYGRWWRPVIRPRPIH